MAVSLFYGWGLCLLFEAVCRSKMSSMIVTFTAVSIMQSVFDNSYKMFTTCGCVQEGVCHCIKCCCERLGKCAVILLTLFGLIFFIIGAVMMGSGPNREDCNNCSADDDLHSTQQFDGTWGGATWKFFASKSQAIFFTSFFASSFTFFLQRRKQLKPVDKTKYKGDKKWTALEDSQLKECVTKA